MFKEAPWQHAHGLLAAASVEDLAGFAQAHNAAVDVASGHAALMATCTGNAGCAATLKEAAYAIAVLVLIRRLHALNLDALPLEELAPTAAQILTDAGQQLSPNPHAKKKTRTNGASSAATAAVAAAAAPPAVTSADADASDDEMPGDGGDPMSAAAAAAGSAGRRGRGGGFAAGTGYTGNENDFKMLQKGLESKAAKARAMAEDIRLTATALLHVVDLATLSGSGMLPVRAFEHSCPIKSAMAHGAHIPLPSLGLTACSHSTHISPMRGDGEMRATGGRRSARRCAFTRHMRGSRLAPSISSLRRACRACCTCRSPCSWRAALPPRCAPSSPRRRSRAWPPPPRRTRRRCASSTPRARGLCSRRRC